MHAFCENKPDYLRRDNPKQITEGNTSKLCLSLLSCLKTIQKCDHLFEKNEQQTDDKWKLVLPQAATGAESIQSICRSAALCQEQQARAPQRNAQRQISAFKDQGKSNQNLLANKKDVELVYDPVYDLEKPGGSKDAVTPGSQLCARFAQSDKKCVCPTELASKQGQSALVFGC